MHAQCRQQLDDGLRMFAGNLSQGAMFRDGSVRKRIQAASHALEQPLAHQPRERNCWQPAFLEVARSNQAVLFGNLQNGLARTVHGLMVFQMRSTRDLSSPVIIGQFPCYH